MGSPFEGLTGWLRPWEDCPCGSDEHQRGGHPKELIRRTVVRFDDGHAEEADVYLTAPPASGIVRIE